MFVDVTAYFSLLDPFRKQFLKTMYWKAKIFC